MATQTTQSQTILPAWYTQYVEGLLGRATAATTGDYQPYGMPRIAGFQPEQERAFSGYQQTLGDYQPFLDRSAEAINRGTGSFTDPGVAGRFMNPYIQNVISGIGSTAARNLSENILPQINRTFVGGGSFGGSRSEEFTRRAIRDTQSQALGKQMEALSGAYDAASGLYGAEAGRSMTGANQFMALGEQQQEQRGRALGGLEAIGAKRQELGQQSADLAYGDFQRQRDFPLTQVQQLAGIGGTPSAAGTGSQIRTEPGTSGFGSALGTAATVIGALGTAGAFGKGGTFGRRKEGGAIESPVKNGKRNIKHPMHGLGWLKDVR